MLLINVLHQVKNSNKDIDEDLIKDTANNIATQGKYKDYAEALKEAAKDIPIKSLHILRRYLQACTLFSKAIKDLL